MECVKISRQTPCSVGPHNRRRFPRIDLIPASVGDLEITISRRFALASGVKALMNRTDGLDPQLAELAALLGRHFESSSLGGLGRTKDLAGPFTSSWQLSQESGEPTAIPPRVWASFVSILPGLRETSQVTLCNSITRGGIKFSTGRLSSRDSQISYYGGGGGLRFGRIHTIVSDGTHDVTGIAICVERYSELSPFDATKDPFRRHWMVGERGHRLFQMVYDSFEDAIDVIKANDIIGHIGRCRVSHEEGQSFENPPIITIQLDRVSSKRCGSS